MTTKDDDKLLHQLFDEEPAAKAMPAPPAPAPKAPPKVVAEAPAAPPTAPVPEGMEREASQLFAELMVSNRAPVVTAAPAVALPPEEEPLRIHQAPSPAAGERGRFADSLSPWTLFRGFAVLAMLAYVVGFPAVMERSSWITLLVVATALTGLVLVVDFLRLGTGAKK